MVSEISVDVGMAVLLAPVAPLYKVAWIWCQSCAGLGVSMVVAHLGEPDLPVTEIPKIAICPSFTHTHTTHVYTHPLSFILSHSLPPCWPVGHHV